MRHAQLATVGRDDDATDLAVVEPDAVADPRLLERLGQGAPDPRDTAIVERSRAIEGTHHELVVDAHEHRGLGRRERADGGNMADAVALHLERGARLQVGRLAQLGQHRAITGDHDGQLPMGQAGIGQVHHIADLAGAQPEALQHGDGHDVDGEVAWHIVLMVEQHPRRRHHHAPPVASG